MNAVVVSDNNGIKIDKNVNSQKIDTVDAVIDGMAEAMYHFESYSLAEEPKKKNFMDRWSAEQVNEYYMNLTF